MGLGEGDQIREKEKAGTERGIWWRRSLLTGWRYMIGKGTVVYGGDCSWESFKRRI